MEGVARSDGEADALGDATQAVRDAKLSDARLDVCGGVVRSPDAGMEPIPPDRSVAWGRSRFAGADDGLALHGGEGKGVSERERDEGAPRGDVGCSESAGGGGGAAGGGVPSSACHTLFGSKSSMAVKQKLLTIGRELLIKW